MVKMCSYNYPKSNEHEYQEYYDKYSYQLHDFQKWSIESIVTGNHVLVCCPTGSGKTFSGEFALDYFHSKGKKVIYTTPIKALSNEKYYNFEKKYPHISIGIITGDLKHNPDADVLIMTTEILLNKLYQIKSSTSVPTSSISFDMDIQNELGCVVFDEIHMINDESRGHAWEQSIMMLPSQVQMVGLSATLDNPERFAYWLETRGSMEKIGNKEVFLTRKQERSVPLIHYGFVTVTNTVFKHVKDKALQQEIRSIIDKPFVVQDAKGQFSDTNYKNITKMLELFEKNDIRVKRQHVLNKVTEYLVEKEMLPALCYVFSRKQLEKCAAELTTNLLEFDSKVPYIIDRECEQIIRKLPNFEEYLHLPEYINTVKLLRKGVGIHHAGLIPIFREMTEMLFAKGYIKILFCTETMSVGINLPVKTTIFTDVNKFNGEIIRMLHSHEYTQAAGRAGRLGLDTVGHVVHLNNLFRNVETVNYKKMMDGKPQTLTSKFKISFQLLLNLLSIGDQNMEQFARKSMVTTDLDAQMKEQYDQLQKINLEIDNTTLSMRNLRTPTNIIQEYIDLKNRLPQLVNKKRKEAERQIQKIQDNYKSVEQDRKIIEKLLIKQKESMDIQTQMDKTNRYLNSGIGNVLNILKNHGFVSICDESVTLLLKGQIASQIKETHSLVFANIIEDKTLDTMSAEQLVSLFSCFTNINVKDDKKEINLNRVEDHCLKTIVEKTTEMYEQFHDEELRNNINTGMDYSHHFDLLGYINEWCLCEDVNECKIILQRMDQEKEIFLGEFVKAILKINNISCEMEKIAEMTGNISLLSKLKEIPKMTMKFVVTNQSLYV